MVDDDPEILIRAHRTFAEIHGHTFLSAANFEQAIELIGETPGYIVAFVDLALQGKRGGLDLLRFIQEEVSHRVVPYVFTADESTLTESKALQAGAINVFHKNEKDVYTRLVNYTESSLVLRLVRREGEDELTGFLNKKGFHRQAIPQMQSARDRRDSKHPELFTLLFIELVNFKQVNENGGQEAADALVKLLASVIRSNVRPTDLICRLGDDEFMVWMPDVQFERAYTVAEAIECATSEDQVTLKESPSPMVIRTGISQVNRDQLGEHLNLDLKILISEARGQR